MMGFNFLHPFPQGLGVSLNAAFHKFVLREFPIMGKGNFQTDPSGYVSSMPGDGNCTRCLLRTRQAMYEGDSNENLKSAIKIQNTARLSCKLTIMILMV
jgi:hypothetical protein